MCLPSKPTIHVFYLYQPIPAAILDTFNNNIIFKVPHPIHTDNKSRKYHDNFVPTQFLSGNNDGLCSQTSYSGIGK